MQKVFLKHKTTSSRSSKYVVMKKFLFLLLAVLIFSRFAGAQHAVGVNLAAFRDWSSEFVFKDAFKMCREWTQINLADGSSSSTFNIALRPDGYPQQLPLDSAGKSYGVRTYLFTDATYPIPTGNFTLIAEGTGTIRVRQNGFSGQTYACPGTHAIPQTEGTHFIIDILQSDAIDPVRNIRFVMPGFLDTYETEPFHPEFLSFLEPFQCLRFTAWMRSTGSTIVEWPERTPVNYYSQTVPFWGNVPYRGVAYEHMADLCNLLGKNAWVNIPHMASDDYIRQFALFLRDHLDPSLKIYLEYSNETWNTLSDYTQSTWVLQQGQAAGYPGPSLNQRALFTAKRAADAFRIFDSVFENQESRLVKVLTAQAGNTTVAQTLLNAFLNNVENVNPDGVGVDAFGIAPFFGNLVTSATSVEDALDQAEESLSVAYQRMANHRSLMQIQGWSNIPFITYEAGQHLNASDAATDAIFCAANHDERMGELYCQYLQHWFDTIGGGLMMHYNSVSPCNNQGSWGLKEYTGQPDEEAPKWLALKQCALTTGAGEAVVDASVHFRVLPNPASGQLQILLPENLTYDRAEIFDSRGQLAFAETGTGCIPDMTTLTPGLYFLVLKNQGRILGREKVVR